MIFTPALLVFGVQGLIKLGRASRDAYEQYVRDRPASLPLLGVVELTATEKATAFFRQPENNVWVSQGGAFAAHWDANANDLRDGIENERAIVVAWLKVCTSPPSATPFEPARSVAFLVRQWEGDGPPPPWLRLALALADVALDFGEASPALLGPTGTSQPLLEAVAALADRSRALLPDLNDPEQWKGDRWIRANFAQSLLVTVFRAGLTTLADNPGIVIRQEHLQPLLAATIRPLRDGFETAWSSAPAGAQLGALVRWETVRDQWLPAMAAGAIRAVAQDRGYFIGKVIGGAGGSNAGQLVGALANSLLDEAATLGGRDLLLRDTWIRFWSAAVGVIATRPELVVPAGSAAVHEQILRELVKQVAGKLTSVPAGVNRALLLELAATTLEVVNDSLPLVLRGDGWNGVARDVVSRVLDALQPALREGDPLLLQRLATPAQAVDLVAVVLGEIAASPQLVVGGAAGPEVSAVVSAVAAAMAAKGAELLTAKGWLLVASAAAEAAARNPGRLFKLEGAAAGGVGIELIRGVLLEASELLEAGRPPVVGGAVLAELLVEGLNIIAVRAATPAQIAELLGILRTLAKEAASPNGLILPGSLPPLFARVGVQLLARKIPAAATVAQLLEGVGQ
ncbi:hypothetical protein [Reyranella sp.]|uniref:hypothetical protein n=2 Tax=Reyranella sp. TaxID=1929291 RepID=UPI003D0A4522